MAVGEGRIGEAESAIQRGQLVRTGKARTSPGVGPNKETLAGKTNHFFQPACSTNEMFQVSFFVLTFNTNSV